VIKNRIIHRSSSASVLIGRIQSTARVAFSWGSASCSCMMLLVTCGGGSNQQDKRKDRKIDGSPSQAKNSLLRLYMSIVAGGVLSKTSFPRSLASCPLLGSCSASWVRSLGTWLQFCEAVQKSASRRSPLISPKPVSGPRGSV